MKGQQLQILQTQVQDQGMYHCMVEKKDGEKLSGDAKLRRFDCRTEPCLSHTCMLEKQEVHGYSTIMSELIAVNNILDHVFSCDDVCRPESVHEWRHLHTSGW